MADKTVRLRSVATGVVVETSEENAARLPSGTFEPVETKATSTRKSSSKSSK